MGREDVSVLLTYGDRLELGELDIPADRPADTHLSAFLDSPVFARSSPPVTQMAIRKALEDYKSELLEVGLFIIDVVAAGGLQLTFPAFCFKIIA
jgi:hypothetical protein